MTERWLPVVGYEGLYEVSDLGRLRSVDRVISVGANGLTRVLKGVVLRTRALKYGHKYATLSKGNVPKTVKVHLAVLTAFVGSRPVGMYGCHNDGDASNNRLDNLRWDTPASNIQDAVRQGTQAQVAKTHCPKLHPYSGDNLEILSRGGRRCKACRRARDAQRSRRKVIA